MSSDAVTVTVNGQPRRACGIRAHTSALDWLRSQGLTGAKEGCAEGECGACAVLVLGPDGEGTSRWTAVNSCLVPAAALDGQEVLTSEGLGEPDHLHPVQQAMAVRGGSQCGYCTPGFVCSMAAEFYRPDRYAVPPAAVGTAPSTDGGPVPTAEQEQGPNGFDLHALGGNLCRCTGYRPIRDAAYALTRPQPDDPWARRQERPAPGPRPTRFTDEAGSRFVRPADLAEAVALLAEEPDAVVVAGGTDLGVEVNLRHRRPELLVAVDRVPELNGLTCTTGHVEIGAAVTLTRIERELGEEVALLGQLVPQFASRLIRNRATLGGNLGTASPIGDSPPVLLALGATVVLASATGEREVPLEEYFTGYRETLRRPGELIRAVRVPLPPLPQTTFAKIAKRRFDDISSVAVAVAARIEDGAVHDVRIGLGGVAATPLRARATEDALRGRAWTAETVERAAEVLAGEGTPMDDHRASASYRAAMLGQALRRFAVEVVPVPEVAR
jgi:xanthine dehydrogenase small subunit